ncbi:MAG: helix-turn-helix domain-containing protein [Phycisphaerae bacterium]
MKSIEDQLREAIHRSKKSNHELWHATGVHRASIARFLRRERTLRLDVAAKIAAYLKLSLKQE